MMAKIYFTYTHTISGVYALHRSMQRGIIYQTISIWGYFAEQVLREGGETYMTWYKKAVISVIGIGVLAFLFKKGLYGENPILFAVIALVVIAVAGYIWSK